LPPGKIPNADFVKGVATTATAFMLSDSSGSNPFYVIMSSNKNPPPLIHCATLGIDITF